MKDTIVPVEITDCGILHRGWTCEMLEECKNPATWEVLSTPGSPFVIYMCESHAVAYAHAWNSPDTEG